MVPDSGHRHKGDTQEIMDTILQLKDISKNFGNTRALKNISLDFQRGVIYGLVGENGAGKSTLMKVISGIIQPDSGEMLYDNQSYHARNPWQALEMGVLLVPQEIELVAEMSVAENIFLGNWLGRKWINHKEMERQSREVLDSIGFSSLNPRSLVSSLTTGEKQAVQIAKAFSKDPKILILDEPSAVLTPHEMDAVFRIIKNLKKQGVTVIYISHYLDEVLTITEKIAILRDGYLVDVLSGQETGKDHVVQLMTGGKLERDKTQGGK